ncbi:MAG: NTP transferase domain-containing protein [Rhodospirillales bacterium]|jgi:spore coat polysaccharide biosynthesis protein SpsF (cytidylyltransferase family)|nr:NTP transferase domain-containing protein [Rhodospirillales bacterium]
MNIAVIQARMASTRLPGKSLLRIGKHPIIHYVLERAREISGVEGVVLATSMNAENDPLAEYAARLGFEFFRGDEDDVIERFYQVALQRRADTIIRLTGDNPLIDFHAMGRLLAWHNEREMDYSCMTGFPTGALGDIFSFRALEESHEKVDGKALCDHVDLYVLENRHRFKLICWELDTSLSAYRWTVDDAGDLERMRRLEAAMGAGPARFERMNTREALEAIGQCGLRQDMQPKLPNVSRENLYTAELVAKLEQRESVSLAHME